MAYKNILTGYVNERKDKTGEYLALTNTGDADITLKPGEKIYLNKTPLHILEKNPKIPHFSKSVKIEEENQNQSEDISGSIPF